MVRDLIIFAKAAETVVMKDQSNNQLDERIAKQANSTSATARRRTIPIIVAVVGVTAIVAIVAIWLLRPKQAGKAVAAPRTVSFEQSSETPVSPTEQTLTLTPEQLRSVQLKIETVGEAPSTEAAGQMATGVVQPNSYKETPVVSLV